MLPKIPRTLGTMICLMCLVPLTMAGTRMMVSGGFEASTEFRYESSITALHLQTVTDAPSWIRKHVPLELAVGYTGAYPEHRIFRGVYDAIADWSSSHYYYWTPHYRLSEAVRIYATSRFPDNQRPDGLEVGFGIGNHQVVSRQYDQDTGQPTGGGRIESQWRAELFLRAVLFPSQPMGLVLEADVQRELRWRKNHEDAAAASLTLGWRFHV